jgi:hypothetical protein
MTNKATLPCIETKLVSLTLAAPIYTSSLKMDNQSGVYRPDQQTINFMLSPCYKKIAESSELFFNKFCVFLCFIDEAVISEIYGYILPNFLFLMS